MSQTPLLKAPSADELEQGWRELDSGDANVPNAYECLRPHEGGDGYCSETFQTRRALGSHQGRGHTRKAKAQAGQQQRDELATAIGRSVIAGELDTELEGRVLRRIRALATADAPDTAEIASLANFLIVALHVDEATEE